MTNPVDPTTRPEPFQDGSLRDTLAWVLHSLDQPAVASGDWIAYEVDAKRGTAVALLTDPTTPLARLRRARILWGALRSEGERAEDRSMGSRLAIAAAAAAYLFHGERISNHDDAALLAALRSAVADEAVPAEVRLMMQMAERKLTGPIG
jgi:hypothetical protein